VRKLDIGIDEKTVREIVARVVRTSRPDRIILFGSAATDNMTPNSDIDLLVLHRSPVDAREERLRIRKVLRGLGLSFDIIVMATDRFEESKEVIGGIAYPANKYGKTIYEAA